MPIAEEFWKLCAGVTQGGDEVCARGVIFLPHAPVFSPPITHTLIRKISFLPAFASLAHLLFQQGTKSDLRGKWTSKANGRRREWAPCSGRGQRSRAFGRTNLRPDKVRGPYTIKTDDDEDTAVT